MSTIQAFFFIGIYFFYFISNNNCRLLTINIVSFIFFYYREAKPPYLRQPSIDFDFCNISSSCDTFSIQSCRSCYATLHLCQHPFYKIFVKFRNSKKNVLKLFLIIVNINKDENKSLISNQFSLKNDL
jgi:hypothetical protein